MNDAPDIRSTILKRDRAGVVRNGAEWLALWSDPASMQSRAERSQSRQAESDRMVLLAQLAAAARSLSGDETIDIELTQAETQQPGLRIHPDELSGADVPALRGRVDSAALFRRFHEPALHGRLAPPSGHERGLFDLLEMLRCEALGAARFPGVGENLVAAHAARLARSDLLGAHLAALVPLDEALRMVIGDGLVGRPEASIPTSGFWMWRRWLHQRLGAEMTALRDTLADQGAYGEAALRFIAALFAHLHGKGAGPQRRTLSKHAGDQGDDAGDGDSAASSVSEGDERFEPGPDVLDGAAPLALPSMGLATATRPLPYRVFTTRHDRTLRAADLVSPAAMRDGQARLDRQRTASKRLIARLVAQLQRRIMARQRRSWTFDLEEGLIDAARLDRVVVNPGFADAYKQEDESLFRDTCVTLLIDNSGSMRGKTIELACIAADLICAALENCSVATEVLGFTTGGWKGGQSAQDWARAGRPEHPGRLNDLLHVVYKSADEPYRHARLNLFGMLSNDVLKENIDGEALAWAARRLQARPEQRRILLVISDGAPVDQATLEANADGGLLDRHLREIIGEIERGGQIELGAIGVRHDVDRYYRVARRIDSIDDLGAAIVGALDALLLR